MDDVAQFGSKLKQVREAKGISLEEVQAKTKISIDILRSIEREEKLRNVSPVYLKGFIKIYAKFLGVSIAPAPVLPLERKPQSFNTDQIKLSLAEKKDYFLWVKIFLTLALLVILIFFAIKQSHRIKSSRPPKAVKSSKVVAVSKELAPAKPTKAKPAPEVPIPKINRIKLAVLAKDNTWLQVKLDGKTVFRQVLRKGSSENWAAKEKIELSLGNAAGLVLELNDKIISSLGRKNQALKNVVITKDGLSVNK